MEISLGELTKLQSQKKSALKKARNIIKDLKLNQVTFGKISS